MSELVRTQRDGDVLVVEIDNPPVNALGPGVPEALAAVLDAADRDDGVAAIVIRGAGRTFVAGADIATLEDAAWGDEAAAADLHDLLRRVEQCRTPVVMAIHGTALGGGLELAMAGHYRVADAAAQVGQPEVNLGIVPGAEGTQRLPRLAGVAKALDMCVFAFAATTSISRPHRRRAITVYGQNEIVRDLIAARRAAGGRILFDAELVALRQSRHRAAVSPRADG